MDTLKWIPGRLQTPKISHNLRLEGLFLIALVEGFFNSKKMKSQKSKMESPNTWMGAIKWSLTMLKSGDWSKPPSNEKKERLLYDSQPLLKTLGVLDWCTSSWCLHIPWRRGQKGIGRGEGEGSPWVSKGKGEETMKGNGGGWRMRIQGFIKFRGDDLT